jgi:tetratricopeptide (TPR) repeat protein
LHSNYHPLRLKRLTYFIVFVLTILGYNPAFADIYVQKKDSLERILRSYTADDKTKVDILLSICSTYDDRQYFDTTFLNYAQYALSIANKLKYKIGVATGKMYCGQYFVSKRDTSNALANLNQALSIYTQLNDPAGVINTLLPLGKMHIDFLQYKESISNYNKALDIAIHNNFDGYQSILYRELGHVFYRLLDFSKALEFYQKALNIAERAQLKQEKIKIFRKIGEVYYHLDKFDITIDYSNKIITLAMELNDQKSLAAAIAWQGNIQMVKNDFKGSLEKYATSIAIRIKNNDDAGLASDYANVAFLYQLIGDFNNSLKYHNLCETTFTKIGDKYSEMLHYKDMGNLIAIAPDSILQLIGINPKLRYSVALNYENRALHIAKILDDSPQKIYINTFIIDILKQSGDYKIAFHTLQDMMAVRDSLSGQEVKAQVARQEAKHFFEKKEAEIQLQNTKFRFYVGIFIMLLIILACIGFGLYYISKLKYQKRQLLLQHEKEKAENELAQAHTDIRAFLKNIADKNTIIQSVSDELDRLKQIPDYPKEIIAHQLADLKSKIILTNDDWLDFLKSFNRLYPQFTVTIKKNEPSITASELRYLMLIKIGMDHKEMASTLGISSDAVRVTWNRTRNKLNGTIEDTPYSLLEKLGVA